MSAVKKRKSLNSGLILILITVLALIVVTFLVSTSFVLDKTRYDYEMRESETMINGVAGSVSAGIGTFKNLSRLVMLNDEAVVFLRADRATPGNINDARYGVMDVMNATTNLDSIFIIRNDGAYMNTGKGVYDVDFELWRSDEWKDRILSERGGAIIMMNAGDAVRRTNYGSIVTIARAIYDINSQKLTGILLMNFSTSLLQEAIENQGSSALCVISTEGEFLAGNESIASYMSEEFVSDTIVHTMIDNGSDNAMISGYRIPDTPLVVLCYTDSKVSVLSNTTMYALISMGLVFIVAIILAANFITRNITKPLSDLTGAIEKTKKSGYLEKLDVAVPNNEIASLSDSYNGMVEHVNQLFEELIEKEKSVQRAEMRVLHEQIKPHFLYNSMETIGYMALNDGATDVHEALETLGSFYRNFLSKGDRDIPLSREISIIKDYLSIQKLRYGDIIIDEYDVADDVKDWQIPKLLLQPLVENSIYHGIRLKGEAGVIKITGYAEDGDLHLIVYDSGLGMEQEVIERLLSTDASDDSANKDISGPDAAKKLLSGFGLRGTIERVRYFCGRDDVVKIRSELGEYAEIEFIIPAREN